MTSSLVGSEMCIRDSLFQFPSRKAQVAGSIALHLALSAHAVARHMLAPVSYTHLTLPTICSV
eukprot:8665887-Prorocentrum_lima.AAC.1